MTYMWRRGASLVAALLVALFGVLPVAAAADPGDGGIGPATAAGEGRQAERLLVKTPATGNARGLEIAFDAVGARPVERLDDLGVIAVEVPGDLSAAQRALEASPAVAYAEPDEPVYAMEPLPNDPLFGLQWGLERINATGAWASTVGDPSVTIAVLDTGIDGTHEDLEGAVVPGWDFIDNNDDPSDEHGHGTLSAGVAAARTDNARGIAGVCWTCEILAVRVLDHKGEGSTSHVAAGITYAADAGAEVISLSLGSLGSTHTLRSAVDHAVAQGSLVVASAGNGGNTNVVYPAAYDNVVGVAGSETDDTRSSWSTHGTWVDLAAPGCNPSTSTGSKASYVEYCGTSSAAPVVAGVAGLAFAHRPNATNEDVRAALHEAATPVSYVAHGRVDAAGTLDALGPPTVARERFGGANRYETAALASAATFKPGVERVYLATGRAFPDALAAGPAAAVFDAPVLLTDPSSLPAATEAELVRLAPDEVVVVGGPSAVAESVLTAVAGATGRTPTRVAGANRFETAAAIAAEAFDETSGTVYVATGLGFADALSGTPAAALDGAPILLTTQNAVPETTLDALAALAPEEIVVLGGTAVVAEAVVGELAHVAPVSRVAGANRYATAAEVAARAYPDTAAVAVLATGANFPDALAGGPVAAHRGGPLLLAHPQHLPAEAAAVLQATAPTKVLALGSTGVLSEAIFWSAAQAAGSG